MKLQRQLSGARCSPSSGMWKDEGQTWVKPSHDRLTAPPSSTSAPCISVTNKEPLIMKKNQKALLARGCKTRIMLGCGYLGGWNINTQ